MILHLGKYILNKLEDRRAGVALHWLFLLLISIARILQATRASNNPKSTTWRGILKAKPNKTEI
jgi:hypothetical protein